MCVERVLTLHMRKCAFSDYKSQTGRNYIFSLFYAAIIEGIIKESEDLPGQQSVPPHRTCAHGCSRRLLFFLGEGDVKGLQ